ncbi:MAG: molybdopterin-guanine dinucleotide biosynthesis protein MobB [Spirochaetes bacterium]|nr:molybdopterin-guanine dinucleotide biosynthesis protein MobB [Spirochaetota bacterium]
MRGISIVGFKKSGKTTLCAEVAGILTSRGLKVATAKFTHNPLDRGETDTWRLSEVSAVTAGMSDSESMLLWRKAPPAILQLLPLMAADVLIVEGGKSLSWLPRVILAKTTEEAEALSQGLALAVYGPRHFPGLPAMESPSDVADLVLSRGFVLPGLDCGSCGEEDCRGLARTILRGEASPDDCRALRREISITIDGIPVPMNDFVSRVITGAMKGMLGELKGTRPGRVRIEFDA